MCTLHLSSKEFRKLIMTLFRLISNIADTKLVPSLPRFATSMQVQNSERFADRDPRRHFGKFDGEGRNISQRYVIGISAHLMMKEISKH